MRNNLEHGLLHAMTAFVGVVDTGSFTSAASRMSLTTPQVSRLVSDLENRLHTKLLQRTTRKLALTPAGNIYAEQCRNILEMIREAESVVNDASTAASGPLRVSCQVNFGNRYVAPQVAAFCKRFPEIALDYVTFQDVPDMVRDGIDVSIFLSHQLENSTVVAKRLGSAFSILCASPEYLERSDCGVNQPQDLKNHICLRLINPSVPSKWVLHRRRERFDFVPSGSLISNNADVLLHATISGLGIALLPGFAAIDALQSGKLVPVLRGWKTTDLGVFALYPSRRFVDAKTKAWIDMLTSAITPALETDARYLREVGYL